MSARRREPSASMAKAAMPLDELDQWLRGRPAARGDQSLNARRLCLTVTEMPEEGSAFPEQSWTMESDRRPFKKRGDLIVGGGPVKRAGVMSWMSATSSA